jgi:alanine racemase
VHRGAIAEIDLNAIAHNLDVVKAITRGRPVIAVVKADAYGHGAVEVSKKMIKGGVHCLAVAFNNEAVQLREAGLRSKILVLFERHDIREFFDYGLTPVVHDLETARRLHREARKRIRRLNVHVKIDTGMGRLGFNNENVVEDIIAISKMDYLNIEGILSHFSEADIRDKSCAQEQLAKFNEIRKSLSKTIRNNFLFHIANSAATMSFKGAHMDAVRPGIMLYGCSPVMGQGSRVKGPGAELKPAMRVRTSILTLRKVPKGTPISYGGTFITRRESLIAVMPVGYADGYCRAFSNNADVLVRGKRAPVVGRVCMDLTMVDATGIQGVKDGDEVVLLGRQGKEEITAWDLAKKSGTIPYEVLTSLGNRSKRIYIRSMGQR